MVARKSSDAKESPNEELNAIDGLVQLSFLVQNCLARCAGEHRLSLIQTRLLGVLRDREPSMNELAKLLDLDKSSVTGLINRAELRGLVRRVPSTTDRRTVLISLTDEARSLVTTISRQFEQEISMTLDLLTTPERETLSHLVSQLLVARASKQGFDLFTKVETEGASRIASKP
jgi:MarR family transcriptional regulator, lower aerobic nicotinate degradation pathway regulator